MELVDSSLERRLCEIRSRINDAAQRSGRIAEKITLVAVSKYVDVQLIKKAQKLGINHFGESKAQDFTKKYEEIPEVNWHFVGRLQTNKVKYLIGKVSLIHSLDRIELAREIDIVSKNRNIITDVLVQVNVSGEISKAGISVDDCERFIIELSQFKNINVRGLMNIGPFIKEKDEIRRNFANLNKLFIDITRKKIHNINMDYLSAGMTNDFESAIEEGANMVRIGTGLFGERKRPELPTNDNKMA